LEQFIGKKWSEKKSMSQKTLTPLGLHLSKIPVDVRLGKMLILGALFKCLNKVITIAASLSTKSPFAQQMDRLQNSTVRDKSLIHESSDFLTLCNFFEAFQLAAKTSERDSRTFCDKQLLNHSVMLEISAMRQHFVDLLESIGFVTKPSGNLQTSHHETFIDLHNSAFSKNSKLDNVVTSIVCAGFYPHVAFVQKESPDAPIALYHKKQRLHFHSSSVNYNKKTLPSSWIVFHEKFATGRVSVSNTSTTTPFSLLLFGGKILVKHSERGVIIDDWIELSCAAKTSVMFRELRNEIDFVLKDMIERVKISDIGESLIDGIVDLLAIE